MAVIGTTAIGMAAVGIIVEGLKRHKKLGLALNVRDLKPVRPGILPEVRGPVGSRRSNRQGTRDSPASNGKRKRP